MKLGIPKMSLNKNIITLLFSILIMHIGLYVLTPMLPVILSSGKGLDIGKVGIIIGIGSLAFQVGSVVGGLLGNKIGNKTTMIIGAAMQSAALFFYGISSTFTLLLIFSIINGTGSGIYSPTVKAAIASLASNSAETKTTAFSLRGIAANLGVGIAGLVIVFFSIKRSYIPFFVSAFIFFILTVITFIMVPKDCGGSECPNVPVNSYLLIFKNKPFLIFSILSVFIWAIYSQLSILLPLRTNSVLSSARLVGTIWTIRSLVVIIFQSMVSKYILQRLKPFTSLMFGMLFFGGGILLIGFSYNFIFLILSAIVFVMGEMLMLPVTDILTSDMAHPKLIGAYFSISNLISGLGTALGSFIGGRLMDIYGVNASIYPWMLLSLSSIVIGAVIFVCGKFFIISKA